MADEADIANEYIDKEVAVALGRIRQNFAGRSGPKVCAECGDKIPQARRKLGFQFCITCAEESERRGSLFAD